MEQTPTPDHDPGGLDRRAVLRRGAILGGAMVWTVPAVQTLAGPAFAAGSPCIGRFEYTTSRGRCFFVEYNATETCCDCVDSILATEGPEAVVLAGAICQVRGACTVKAHGPC